MTRILPFILAAVCIASVPLPAARPKTRILLIGHKPDHPPGTHMYLQVCGLLAKCLNQTKGVDAFVSDGWPQDSGMLRDLKAIVFYTSPGGTILLDPTHRAEAETMMKNGTGLCAIHWATD